MPPCTWIERLDMNTAASLAALELSDAFGQKTVVRFGELDRSPSLAADAFRFTPPQGASVIGDK